MPGGSFFEPKNLAFGTALPLTFFFSWLGLGSTPIPVYPLFDLPLIVFLVRATKTILYDSLLFGFLAFSIGLSYRDSSSTALNSPFDNLAVIILVGSVIAFLTILPAYVEKTINEKLKKSNFFLFAGLWMAVWLVYRRYSPFGSWGDWAYTIQGAGDALIQSASLFGLSGIDFLLAWWAHVGAEILNELTNAGAGQDDLISYEDDDEGTPLLSRDQREIANQRSRKRKILSLFVFLAVFTYGASRINDIETNTQTSNIVKVACALSSPSIDESPKSEMIKRTKKLVTIAKLVLWSESAVRLESTNEMEQFLTEIKSFSTNHSNVGVTYIVPTGDGKYRNVLSFINREGEVVFNYTKTHPVPIAEGYSTISGPGILPITEIDVREAKKTPLPLKISAAICFDMDFPSLVAGAASANLMLSPAQTWSSRIGLEHLRMASVRAIEQGFWLLRCDAGGVSGLVDDIGRIRNWQVASKDGVNDLIFDLPLSEKRTTIYSKFGDWGPLAILALIALLTAVPGSYVESFEEHTDNLCANAYKKALDALPRSSQNNASYL
ncbi:7426_t:CDS:1 [Ambispora gerdemannii]|uniref:7426_t:CDS:1 n=1 Tax=Ambispora gerdemannii TaxID=144530 RepID=A0A9N8ZEJ9_9GLOM|nr:7426_t:CDS:1 [Ambispora gerdemannii]